MIADIEQDENTQEREKARLTIIKLIFIIYGLFLFEGAVRRWIFPGARNILFFIKDPFVLIVYFLAFKNQLLPKKVTLFSTGLLLAVIGLLIVVVQSFDPLVSKRTLEYGWRMWFYYLPLSFIIGSNFKGEDLKRLVKWTLLIAIPLGFLAYLQFKTGVNSIWNKPISGLVYTETGVRGGSIARITGTFTFFHGQQVYVGSIIAFIISTWLIYKKDRPLKGMFLYIATAAVAVTYAVDITRLPTILAVCALVAGIYVDETLHKRGQLRIVVVTVMLLFFGTLIFQHIFPRAHKTRVGRFDKNYMQARTTDMFFSHLDHLTTAPKLGYGLGVSSRGGSVLGGTKRPVYAGEHEWPRNLWEGGVFFGSCYIFYRIFLVLYLFKGAIKAVHRSGNPLPLLLFSVTGPIILVWYITNIGQINSFAWIFAGLCMAANRLGSEGPWSTLPEEIYEE